MLEVVLERSLVKNRLLGQLSATVPRVPPQQPPDAAPPAWAISEVSEGRPDMRRYEGRPGHRLFAILGALKPLLRCESAAVAAPYL